jgi:hypothetical protein
MFDVPLEKPRAVRQIAEMVYGNPIRYKKLAEDEKMPESLVRSIIEAHATKLPEQPNQNKVEEIQKPKAGIVTFGRPKMAVS